MQPETRRRVVRFMIVAIPFLGMLFLYHVVRPLTPAFIEQNRRSEELRRMRLAIKNIKSGQYHAGTRFHLDEIARAFKEYPLRREMTPDTVDELCKDGVPALIGSLSNRDFNLVQRKSLTATLEKMKMFCPQKETISTALENFFKLEDDTR